MSNDLIPTSGAPNGGAEFSREDLALVGDAFDSPSILPEAEIDKELKEIARFMRDNRSTYFKDEAMQARQRELLAMKAQWDEANAQERRWKTKAAQILRDVPDTDRFEADFDRMWTGLSETERDLVKLELALPASEHPARPAGETDVERFETSDVGAELVKEWGGRARKKLALIQARAGRMMQISDEAIRWFEK
jgi:hypothetical protein